MKAVIVFLVLMVVSAVAQVQVIPVSKDEALRKQVVTEIDLEICRDIMHGPTLLGAMASDEFTVATLQKVIVIQNKRIAALQEELNRKK